MPQPRRIREISELDKLLAADAKQPLLLFKHSTRCPVSSRAHDEYVDFLEQAPDTPTAVVYVVEDRDVSSEVAARLGVRHESPQAFLIVSGKAVWHDSHGNLTARRLAQAYADANATA